MYLNGEAVVQDLEKAVYWLTEAAENGSANAQYNLAVRYICGDGVSQDRGKARYYLTKAANQGLAKAKKGLELLDA